MVDEEIKSYKFSSYHRILVLEFSERERKKKIFSEKDVF
jgi:hypothetical protein